MTPRSARIIATIYLILFAAAVTWPGMVPFNRVEPLILGLPFGMVWIASWVVGGCLILWMVHAVERRAEET